VDIAASAWYLAGMREIVPGILTWPWYSARFGYDFNGFFVRRPDGAHVVVDPVEPSDDDLAVLAREGVARIILTNRNHFRAAARVRERTGARVAVHPADAGFVREKGVTVDDTLAAGDHIGPFVVVAVAGKSPGEIALHWPDKRILLVGDACVGAPAGSLSLLPPAVIDAPDELRRSLARVAAELDFDTLLLADGESILKGGRAALQRLVATFDGPAATPTVTPRQP
jgi:glyoxylase-like metal-dependent hydrolase (beta-lactamase superfamily II)